MSNENTTDCPYYNIAITSLFNIIDREIKKLLPYSIFIIT